MKLNFHFGHNPTLSQLELDAVLQGKEIIDFNHLNQICNRLGGLVSVTDSKGKVLWRHSAKSWYRRDRLKPYFDARKGMLPPKLARIMVNLALGSTDPSSEVVSALGKRTSEVGSTKSKTLLDPFCGTGTVLIEADLLGLGVIGSDTDATQIAGCKTNLNWARVKNYKLLQADATHISQHLDEKIDYIVTEPFMGSPNPKPEKIKNIVTGLKKLYLGCFKDWRKVLLPNATIVMTFPYFQVEQGQVKTSSIIDSLVPLGYNVKTQVNFTRPGAILQREIVVFKYGTR